MAVELSKMATQLAEAAEKMNPQQGADKASHIGGGQDAASNQDAVKFREVMNQQAPNTGQTGGVEQTSAVQQTSINQGVEAQVSDGTQVRSMGDSILDKLQETSQSHADMLKTVENIAESDGNISVSSMLHAQEAMMKVQITEEVETKAEGKVAQTAQTLLKS